MINVLRNGIKGVVISGLHPTQLRFLFEKKETKVECGVCPLDFCSCFGQVFPWYAHFPAFWNGNVYPMSLYMGSI